MNYKGKLLCTIFNPTYSAIKLKANGKADPLIFYLVYSFFNLQL